MTTKKLCLSLSNMNTNSDKISYLPESIRRHILSFLPISDTIRISALSTRWRNVCSSLSHLDFNQLNFNQLISNQRLNFKDFVYQTLIKHNACDITTFKLSVHVDGVSAVDITTWITFAVRHNVQELDINILSGKFDSLPSCLFCSKSLSKLSLNTVTLKLPQVFAKFDNLKALSLVSVEFGDDKQAIRLFWGCPVLEELSIVSCYFKNLDVLKFPSRNLKFLKLVGLSRFQEIGLSFPDLRGIVYSGRPPNFSLESLSSVYNAEFCLTMPPPNAKEEKRDLIEHRVSKILGGLRNVAKLTLEGLCIEFLTRDPDLFVHLPTLYCSLNHLKLDLYPDKNQVQVVILLLRCFPNLRTLSISIKTLTLSNMVKMGGHQQSQESSSESILKCLWKVEIKYFGGSKSELDLVGFLIGNGTVMEEMCITYSPHKQTTKGSRKGINEKVVTFIRASPKLAISFS